MNEIPVKSKITAGSIANWRFQKNNSTIIALNFTIPVQIWRVYLQRFNNHPDELQISFPFRITDDCPGGYRATGFHYRNY